MRRGRPSRLDSDSKLPKLTRLFAASDPFRALAWPASAFNPQLGSTFRGIERHYSDRLVSLGEANGAEIARTAQGVCSVAPDHYGAFKRLMYEIVARDGLKPADLTHCRAFLRELLGTCDAI